VLLSAAATPLWRVTRGETNHVRPVRVRSILALAALIAAATWITWQALALTIGRVAGTHRHVHTNFGSIFGVPVILISLAMLFAIVGAAELAARVLPARPTPLNPPVPSVRAAQSPELTRIGTQSSTAPSPLGAAPSSETAIDARCRELADHRAQLHTARENAANACERLLERFDADRLDIRALTTTLTALAATSDKRDRPHSGDYRSPAHAYRRPAAR